MHPSSGETRARHADIYNRSPAFNLIAEPWLPVQRRSGAVERIQPWRINERIGEDPFVAFAWPRPDFNGAAHEFLIGLLATAAAPANEEDREDWWLKPPGPDVLEQRFVTVAHAFDLDGDGPRFLQDLALLEDVESKDVAALLIDAPGAQTLRNNADLFVKRGVAPVLSRAAAAMALYTLNSYAPSGGAGHRTSLRGGGPMTTLVVASHADYGDTLWGRLWLNVESREQVAGRASAPSLDEPETMFPWLAPTRTSNRQAGGKPTTPSDVHPLQVYWGMPRRIRLVFESAKGRRCGLTGASDPSVAASYRTRNYGIDYSAGFEHPLTPYYRQKKASTVMLPVHPKPGGISYRLWPGLVVPSRDGLREPAQVIRHWQQHAAQNVGVSRFAAFGYDMDNMKARAWSEGEMPLWNLDFETRGQLAYFIQRTTAGAATVARLLTGAVKAATYDRSQDAPGDHSFVAERFFRDTEDAFYNALVDAVDAAKALPESDDATVEVRRCWPLAMKRAALRLFDEFVPADGLENRNMHRYIKARFHLALALGGGGKVGRSLFDGDLGIASPETGRGRDREQKSA